HGSRDAKAGNINAALRETDADVIVVFDVDHVPEPQFLERSLGYFEDPEIGFVQVMLTFSNGRTSWFARAAGESCFDFFNPTSMGMDRLGSATLIGS
ncbi:MAG: glycosyltransferase, partial [Acidobacteria bacterium]|nr:glycosyltransferase [Acidobacteriota bacterium]NIQ86786.1 glycosyltransferase [Acidobacteriota bacterium]